MKTLRHTEKNKQKYNRREENNKIVYHLQWTKDKPLFTNYQLLSGANRMCYPLA